MRLAFLDTLGRIFGYEYTEALGRDTSYIASLLCGPVRRSAITTIAELGYASASFARIAKRAGLSSTGLISYHFANRPTPSSPGPAPPRSYTDEIGASGLFDPVHVRHFDWERRYDADQSGPCGPARQPGP